ncbi:hypothetical protein ElyMa_003404000 [Elysia marginata]|uniref:DDE-1 domain-containing protein n=1 Tax=Elysia marginata TaxID=1093978 RepID=A0AAV4JNN2_9GAST|nr:hypothetical protein ElyMa_003404000 [Elysia marginata]
MPLGKERAVVTPQAIHKWFAELRDYCLAVDPTLLDDPFRSYNSDETGFSFNPKGRKVVACKGAKNVYSVTSNTRTQVTVLATMSASGHYLPPLMIYPYKRIPSKNLLNRFPEAEIPGTPPVPLPSTPAPAAPPVTLPSTPAPAAPLVPLPSTPAPAAPPVTPTSSPAPAVPPVTPTASPPPTTASPRPATRNVLCVPCLHFLPHQKHLVLQKSRSAWTPSNWMHSGA